MFIQLQHRPTVTTLALLVVRIKSTSLQFGSNFVLFGVYLSIFYFHQLPFAMVLIPEKRNPTDPFSLSNALIGRPHQLQKPCFTALSPRAIFMLSFIHKTNALSSFFNNCHAKKLACLYEPQFGRISLNISPSDSS